MKLHRETYSGDFIPYNLPELFQGCEKLEKLPGRELTSSITQTNNALQYTYANIFTDINFHVEDQCFTKFRKIWRKMSSVNCPVNYQDYYT
jgi:hypothetical protein